MHTKVDMSQSPVGMYRYVNSLILPCAAGNFFCISQHLSYFGDYISPLLFFDNLVVCQNHRVVPRAVYFGVFRNYPLSPRTEAVSRNIPGHYGSRADNAVIPHGLPRAYHYRLARLAVLTDVFYLGVAQQLFLPLRLATYGWPSTLRSPMGYT